METSRYIQEDNTSFKISQLFLVLGLGGIGISLLYNSIPVFILITLIPLFCVGGILLLRYPWLILFVIFTTNYFILGITRYIPIEGISVIMEILYMIALVLIFIQAALFQNIEWRRAFNILSIALWPVQIDAPDFRRRNGEPCLQLAIIQINLLQLLYSVEAA